MFDYATPATALRAPLAPKFSWRLLLVPGILLLALAGASFSGTSRTRPCDAQAAALAAKPDDNPRKDCPCKDSGECKCADCHSGGCAACSKCACSVKAKK